MGYVQKSHRTTHKSLRRSLSWQWVMSSPIMIDNYCFKIESHPVLTSHIFGLFWTKKYVKSTKKNPDCLVLSSSRYNRWDLQWTLSSGGTHKGVIFSQWYDCHSDEESEAQMTYQLTELHSLISGRQLIVACVAARQSSASLGEPRHASRVMKGKIACQGSSTLHLRQRAIWIQTLWE